MWPYGRKGFPDDDTVGWRAQRTLFSFPQKAEGPGSERCFPARDLILLVPPAPTRVPHRALRPQGYTGPVRGPGSPGFALEPGRGSGWLPVGPTRVIEAAGEGKEEAPGSRRLGGGIGSDATGSWRNFPDIRKIQAPGGRGGFRSVGLGGRGVPGSALSSRPWWERG